jgi:hypothetical protein
MNTLVVTIIATLMIVPQMAQAQVQYVGPDMQIRPSAGGGGFAGDNVYNLDGASQSTSLSVPNGITQTYILRVQNDGSASDNFKITGTVGGSSWVVQYFDAASGGTNITSLVTGSGWTTPSALAPGASKDLRVTVKPNSTLQFANYKDVLITAASVTDSSLKDAVKAHTSVAWVAKGDALIKKASEPESAYAIDNVYQTAPSGNQVESQSVKRSSTVIYHVKLQYEGNQDYTDRKLRAEESPESGWTIRYKRGTTDVTGEIHSGYYGLDLYSGTEIITVEMTPDNTVAELSSKSTTLEFWDYLSDDGSATLLDTVRATATVVTSTGTAGSPSDMQIGLSTSSLAGNNVYNLDGTNQTKTQTKSANSPATYILRVQNDGGSSDKFKITGTAGGSGWTVQYFDAVSGGTNITSLVTGSGWTTPASLASQAYKDIRVVVTPDTTLEGSTQKDVLVMATSVATPTKKDVVKASTLVAVVSKADALIAAGEYAYYEDATYALDNVYQTTPSGGQIATQSTDQGDEAVYTVKIQNDGNVPRSFVIKATESSESGWSLEYILGSNGVYDQDNINITREVRSTAGYQLDSLSPNFRRTIYVVMAPSSSVAAGSGKSTTLKVFLDGKDTTVRDAVKATTTVANTATSSAMVAAPLTSSSATAEAATSLIRLRFSTPLDATVASDAAHYRVQINGAPVAVESAAYQSSINTVILAVPEGSLQVGDAVTVSWDDLLDTRGNPLSGQIGPVTAR